jgi:hypothetical protein
MAVGSVAVSTGVGAASAGEGYLLSLPVSKAVGASDGNFDRADFNSNFVAGGASGFAKGLTGVGPVGGTVIDTVAGAAQSAISDKLRDPNAPINETKAATTAIAWGGTSIAGSILDSVIPIKTGSVRFGTDRGDGIPKSSPYVAKIGASDRASQAGRASSEAFARSTVLTFAFNGIDSCRAGKTYC